MPLKVIAVGKKHEAWVQEGISRYQTRLRAPFVLEWVLLPHSHLEGLGARQEESERILSRISSTDVVILLDERGKLLDSPALSERLGYGQLDTTIGSGPGIVLRVVPPEGIEPPCHRVTTVLQTVSPPNEEPSAL